MLPTTAGLGQSLCRYKSLNFFFWDEGATISGQPVSFSARTYETFAELGFVIFRVIFA